MELESGYFRFTATSTKVYECVYQNCQGGKINGTADDLCRKGSEGPKW